MEGQGGGRGGMSTRSRLCFRGRSSSRGAVALVSCLAVWREFSLALQRRPSDRASHFFCSLAWVALAVFDVQWAAVHRSRGHADLEILHVSRRKFLLAQP